MRNLFLTFALVTIFISCNSTSGKKSSTTAEPSQTSELNAVIEVDTLLANPNIYLDQTVSIKGLVVHTCKHSGKKMFLAGSDKSVYVKVVAGNNISIFGKELEGETVVATGKITIMEKSGEKHKDQNNKEEHKEHDEKITSKDSTSGEGCATETKIKRYEMTCDSYSVVK